MKHVNKIFIRDRKLSDKLKNFDNAVFINSPIRISEVKLSKINSKHHHHWCCLIMYTSGSKESQKSGINSHILSAFDLIHLVVRHPRIWHPAYMGYLPHRPHHGVCTELSSSWTDAPSDTDHDKHYVQSQIWVIHGDALLLKPSLCRCSVNLRQNQEVNQR